MADTIKVISCKVLNREVEGRKLYACEVSVSGFVTTKWYTKPYEVGEYSIGARTKRLINPKNGKEYTEVIAYPNERLV